MRRCAYCGTTGKLTREDIFSTFLQDYYPSYRTHIDHRRNRTGRSAPTVRDVCPPCNNRTLGSLDAYMAGLNDTLLSMPPSPDGVDFRYDYHPLLRYLFKVWYNDARASHRRVAEHARFAAYILGRESEPPHTTTLLVALLRDFELVAEDGSRARRTPKAFRLGYAQTAPEWASHIALARIATFNSYHFTAVCWNEGAGRSRRREFMRGFANQWGFVTLSPSRATVHLPFSRIDTFQWLRTAFTGGCGELREIRDRRPPGETRR